MNLKGLVDEKKPSPRIELLNDEDDPVLQMWGVGKEIWAPEGGDAFIARERAEFDLSFDPETDPNPTE